MQHYAKLCYPEHGYDSDKERVKSLSPLIFYPVEEVFIGQSHSSFTIRCEPGMFNTVNFEFFDETMKPIDILNTEYNCYRNLKEITKNEMAF